MKLENTKNASRNIVSGLLLNIEGLLLQFIFRTVFLHRLGVEYLGLNSLFSSILSVLNLAELGLSSSIIFCMYKPIAEEDNEKICALMNFFKYCYEVIGAIILFGGLALVPFLNILIKSDIPHDVNLYVLYFLVLGNTVLSYYLFSYKNCLLSAYQRLDIKTNIALMTALVQYGLQIALLYAIPNYYIYLITNIIFTIFGNVLTAILVDKNYPHLKAYGKLDNETRRIVVSKVKALLLYKISDIVSHSFDSVIISIFLGLKILGKFNNYLYICMAVSSIITIYTSSLTAGIGNNLVLHTRKQNFDDYSSLSFWHNWLIGWCTVCLLCLYQPFILLWAGKDYLLDFNNVAFFVVYFYCLRSIDITNVFRGAVGIWDKDKKRPLISGIFNICLNLIFARIWGIPGVLFSTIAATIIFDLGWSTIVMFQTCFDEKISKYYFKQMYYTIVTLVASIVTYWAVNRIFLGGIATFIEKVILCIMIPNLIYFFAFFKMPGFKNAVYFMKRTLRVVLAKFVD